MSIDPSTDPYEIFSDGILTVHEAADFIGSSNSQVWKLMNQGHIPYVDLGRARRIPKQTLVEFLRKAMTGERSQTGGQDGQPE